MPTNLPNARWGHAIAYDRQRDRLLLHGGATSRSDMLGDTWEWTGARWQEVTTDGPGVRAYAAACYDQGRGHILLHGGRNEAGQNLADTWTWDGRTWTQVADSGPSGRDHHAMVYDRARGVAILFGGFGGGDTNGETWEWDGREWTLVHSGGPPRRAALAMAYDARRETIILYGGLWLGGLYADIWEWDGRGWRRLADPYANPTLDHHSAAFDEARGQFLLFGGKDYRFTAVDSLFSLRGAELTRVSRDGPSARYNSSLVYDSRRQQTLVFGGRLRQGESFVAYADLWAWDGAGWQELALDAGE